MTPTSKPIRISRLLPGIDFGLLLVVLTCGMAGLQWLTGSSEATSDEHVVASTSPEDLTDQFNATQEELERLRLELERKQADAVRLRKELEQAEADRPDVDSTRARRGLAEEDLEKLRQSIERLGKELQQLQQEEGDLQQQKKRLEKLREDIAAIEKTLADLTADIDRFNRENEKLPQEIARLEKLPLNRSSVVVNFTPEFRSERNLRPVGVALTESTVAPIRTPYYTSSQVGMRIVESRVRMGDTVDQALAAGSDFSNLLNEIDPRKEYVYLYVDSSSFGTFRAVREALDKRKIPWGWEPWEGLTVIASSSGGLVPGRTD